MTNDENACKVSMRPPLPVPADHLQPSSLTYDPVPGLPLGVNHASTHCLPSSVCLSRFSCNLQLKKLSLNIVASAACPHLQLLNPSLLLPSLCGPSNVIFCGANFTATDLLLINVCFFFFSIV